MSERPEDLLRDVRPWLRKYGKKYTTLARQPGAYQAVHAAKRDTLWALVNRIDAVIGPPRRPSPDSSEVQS